MEGAAAKSLHVLWILWTSMDSVVVITMISLNQERQTGGWSTLPETTIAIAPANGWLEDEISFPEGICSGASC